MNKLNELSIKDLEAMHETVGMEFVIEGGLVQEAFIPEERIEA